MDHSDVERIPTRDQRLAGGGALTALVVATLPSTRRGSAILLLFGVGSTLGMVALSGLLGW